MVEIPAGVGDMQLGEIPALALAWRAANAANSSDVLRSRISRGRFLPARDAGRGTIFWPQGGLTARLCADDRLAWRHTASAVPQQVSGNVERSGASALQLNTVR